MAAVIIFVASSNQDNAIDNAMDHHFVVSLTQGLGGVVSRHHDTSFWPLIMTGVGAKRAAMGRRHGQISERAQRNHR
jgi:hypothetical protein